MSDYDKVKEMLNTILSTRADKPVSIDTKWMRLNSKKKLISEADFHKKAQECHGFNLKPKIDEEDMSCKMNLEDLDAIDENPNFMAAPLFEKGERILMVAKQKVGKSLLGMDLTFMIASGGSIGQRLSAPKPYKTLFIDAEMHEKDFKRRFKKMKDNYANQNNLFNNFTYLCMQSLRKRLDLSTEKDQKWVEERIGDAKFIVFDNLGRLISHRAEKSEVSWEEFSDWLKDLTYRGITVLLVHHENKSGSHRGTGKITDDVDLTLSLKKPVDCPAQKTMIEVNFEDARKLQGEQKAPFSIEYYDEDNRIKRCVKTLSDDGDGTQPESLLSNEEKQRHEVEVVMITAARKIASNIDLKPEDRFIQKKDIEGLVSVKSKTNITDHFNKLCDDKLLFKSGTGKGTKYYASPGPDSPTEVM